MQNDSLDSRHSAVRITIVHDQHKAGDPPDKQLDHALALAADRCESAAVPLQTRFSSGQTYRGADPRRPPPVQG